LAITKASRVIAAGVVQLLEVHCVEEYCSQALWGWMLHWVSSASFSSCYMQLSLGE
jgi:hypothetical protein